MGKLKEAVMGIQDEIMELEGREIDFDEAGRILTERWATKPGKISVMELPNSGTKLFGGRARVKSLGAAESKGEYRFELLEDTATHKAGAILVLRDYEVRAGVVSLEVA